MPRLVHIKQRLKKLKSPKAAVLCLDCGWLGVSWYRHDFKKCPCQNSAMVDGGDTYLRYGAKNIKRAQVLLLTPNKEESK